MEKMMKILIIDDEMIARESLGQQLYNLGYTENFLARGGEEALELIGKIYPDIVFVDICMPDMNGLEFMKAVKKRNINTIFVVLSGYDSFTYAQQSIDLGTYKYLLKPIDDKDLLNTVKTIEQQIKSQAKEREKVYKLSKNISKTEGIIRRQYIYDLLLGNLNKEEKIYQRKTNLNIHFKYKYYRVCMISVISKTSGLITAGTDKIDYELVNFCIENVFSELVMSERIDPYYFYDGRLMGILLNYDKEINKTEFEQIYIQIKAVIDKIENVELTFGVGKTILDINKIRRAYQSAKEVINSRAIYGIGHIYFADDEKQPQITEKNIEAELEDALIINIFKNDKVKIRSIVKSAYEPYETLQKNTASLNRMHLNIFVRLHRELEKLGIDGSNYIEDEFLLYNKIQRFDTLKEMSDFLYEVSIKCIEAIGTSKSNDVFVMINRSKKYIKENLGFNLTLERVAHEVNLSPAYFSKIFKETEGTNFIEYVTHTRMDIAKTMLEKNCKITDICNKIGYADPKHFHKIFKKNVGVTPGNYKKSLHK